MTKRRSPGDGTLFKRKRDGLWIGRVEVPSTDGKRRSREVSSKNRNEAIAKLRKLKADVAAGRDKEMLRRILREELEDYFGPQPSRDETAWS